MVQTIYNGYSGVKSYQTGVDSISNNIANINTNGYRADEIKFESIFCESVDYVNSNSPASNSKGFGVTVASNNYTTQMGSIVNADGSDFNMALTNDRGFFKVGSGNNVYYTRDGAFSLDARGNVVNSSGEFLYGASLGKITSTTSNGMTNASITPSQSKNYSSLTKEYDSLKGTNFVSEPIVIPANLKYPAHITTYVDSAVNLDVDSSLKDSTNVTNYQTQNLNTFYGKSGDKLVATANDVISFTVTTNGTAAPVTIPVGTLNTLQDLAGALSGVVTTTIVDGKLYFDNSAGTSDITFDYANSSQNVLKALGITEGQTVAAGTAAYSSVLQIPSTTFHNSIYDAQGNESDMSSKYTLVSKSGTNEVWEINSKIGSNASTTAYLSFDGSGTAPKLYSDAALSLPITNLVVATDTGTITYNPVSFIDEFGDSYFSTNIYSFADQYRTTSDGIKDGVLEGVNITDDGFIKINFTNGASELYGRVAVATFTNENGLEKLGGNLFKATDNSGVELNGWIDSVVGVAQHKLETSNVKMEGALTNLIIMQRAYSANTKTISTADDMLKEAIGLKK